MSNDVFERSYSEILRSYENQQDSRKVERIVPVTFGQSPHQRRKAIVASSSRLLRDWSHAEEDLMFNAFVLQKLKAYDEPLEFSSLHGTPHPGQGVKGAHRTPSEIGYSRFYRSMWVLLALAGIIWGFIVAGSLFGAIPLGVMPVMTGSVVILGLIVTLFVAGRKE